MAGLGPHAGYILAAYGLTALVLGGLVAGIVADYRRQQRRLATLEARRPGEAGQP
jgi:heme exporter protein D